VSARRGSHAKRLRRVPMAGLLKIIEQHPLCAIGFHEEIRILETEFDPPEPAVAFVDIRTLEAGDMHKLLIGEAEIH
jgi:hypothetical protein